MDSDNISYYAYLHCSDNNKWTLSSCRKWKIRSLRGFKNMHMRCGGRKKHKVGSYDIFRGKYQWRPLPPSAGTDKWIVSGLWEIKKITSQHEGHFYFLTYSFALSKVVRWWSVNPLLEDCVAIFMTSLRYNSETVVLSGGLSFVFKNFELIFNS